MKHIIKRSKGRKGSKGSKGRKMSKRFPKTRKTNKRSRKGLKNKFGYISLPEDQVARNTYYSVVNGTYVNDY